MIEDAGDLLRAAAVERAEDHLHQVLGVRALPLGQPLHRLLQQELHGWILHGQLVPLLAARCRFVVQLNQRLMREGFGGGESIGFV